MAGRPRHDVTPVSTQPAGTVTLRRRRDQFLSGDATCRSPGASPAPLPQTKVHLDEVGTVGERHGDEDGVARKRHGTT